MSSLHFRTNCPQSREASGLPGLDPLLNVHVVHVKSREENAVWKCSTSEHFSFQKNNFSEGISLFSKRKTAIQS